MEILHGQKRRLIIIGRVNISAINQTKYGLYLVSMTVRVGKYVYI